jgi:diguanylate cyclase (GGDEF)-like protein
MIPDTEAGRVSEQWRQEVLDSYGILDTLDEPAYDDLTKLAAFICGTPNSLISFVDRDRQWFKAKLRAGLPETPRTVSFCAHAIQRPDQVLIVPDATRDARFLGNPLVTSENGLRFYAGAPMVSPEGAALGTICVIDDQPRALSPEQIEALRSLSRQVVAQLELRRGQAVLEAANAKLSALSLTDALTCIPNRRALFARLAEEEARARRTGDPLSLLLIDIDHFKSYNDAFGHPAGDQALHMVAQLLAGGARPYDFAARYGGEEFAVILPRTNPPAAFGVAERLCHAVAVAPVPHRRLTISIGVAALDPAGGIDELIRVADRALYLAKNAGRNRVAA